MQSAYFSYPRDFVGTARQARCRLVVRAHADFRATLGKAPGADQTSPEFTQFRRSGAASEVRSRLRFEVTSRSHLAERRIVFWAFCAAARLALDLPFPLVPLAFYRSPAHFCALRCSLDCPPPSPCDPAAPARLVDSAKFFSLRSPPVCSRCDSCRDSGALRKEIKRNGRMKIYRAKIRRFLGECEVSRRRGKDGSINLKY